MDTVNLIILILALAALIYIIAVSQPKKIKEWLIWAVSQVEKELGSGTGQIKLRKVYDMFITKYRFISIFIPFNIFSNLVDSALDIMREMIETNQKVEHYIIEEK